MSKNSFSGAGKAYRSIVLPLLLIATFLVNVAGVDCRVRYRKSSLLDTKPKIAIAKDIKSLYQQDCARCHGSDGNGQTAKGQVVGAPDFTDPKWHELSEDQQLANSIEHGLGQMPAFAGKLNKKQIKMLVTYIRSFKK